MNVCSLERLFSEIYARPKALYCFGTVIFQIEMAKLFWLSAIITLGLVAIQLAGFPTLELIVVFLLLDVIIARYSGERAIKNFGKLAEDYSGKFSVFKNSIGEIEKTVNETQKNMGELTSFMHETKSMHASEQTTMGAIQDALDRHKEDLKMEFKNDMDRMAGKFIEMENDFHDFKRGFASAIGSMDDRLKMIEVPNGNLSHAPETIAEQIQEEYAEIAPENAN